MVKAKSILVAAASSMGSSDYQTLREYWLVRFKDPEWLRTRLPQAHFGDIPMIQEDRQRVLQFMESNESTAWAGSAEYLRAGVRDRGWLYRQTTRLLPKAAPVPQPDNALKAKIDRIQTAIVGLLNTTVRPEHVTPRAIAERTRMTRWSVIGVLRASKELREYVRTLNGAQLVMRRFRWAAIELESEGAPVTKAGLLRKSRLWISKRYPYRAMLTQVVSERAALSGGAATRAGPHPLRGH